MSDSVFPGVEDFTTHHCITGSVRRVYEANGYPISEEMLLGLGSGVGFSYWHFKGTDPFLGGRANFARPGVEGLEKTVGRRTGVSVESFSTTSSRKAESSLVTLLDQGKPVMLMVDMGFLPYLELPDDYHFGGHSVVIAGFDPLTRTVLVGDRDAAMHELTLDQLAQARASTYKPFPPRNQWYTFDFATATAPTADDAWQSIRDCASGMLDPPISNIGVKGIHKAARQASTWSAIMDASALRRTCFNASIFIDATGGTGGGLFRYMYARFLTEAAALTADGRLEDSAREFIAMGDDWEALADVFREAAGADEPADRIVEAAQQLPRLADAELAAWKALEALVPH